MDGIARRFTPHRGAAMLNLMTESWQESELELGGGLRFVDRLTAPHLIAYKSDGSVCLDRAGTGAPRTLVPADRERSVACRLAFSPDGKRLYHSAAQVMEIDLESGRTRALTHFSEDELYAATWDLFVSPDGSTLYFSHMKILGKKYVAKVCALDIRVGQVRTVFDPDARGNVWRFALDGSSGGLLVPTTRPRRLLAMDLDGANAREVQVPE